jgi:hypothetical protein
VANLDTARPPLYQRLAEQAGRLSQLDLKDRAIARQLGTDNKLVAKAVRWWRERRCQSE